MIDGARLEGFKGLACWLIGDAVQRIREEGDPESSSWLLTEHRSDYWFDLVGVDRQATIDQLVQEGALVLPSHVGHHTG